MAAITACYVTQGLMIAGAFVVALMVPVPV